MKTCKTCKYHGGKFSGRTKGWAECIIIAESMTKDNGMIHIGADDDYGLGCETHPDFTCGLYEPNLFGRAEMGLLESEIE